MKVNMPVSDNEVCMDKNQILVSKTDLKGMITFVNRDFIEISGFTKEELIGKNHNIVRHPDMPPEAFADLWEKVKDGKPWTGMVKNRCKNGDFYWVKANVTPVRENGRVVEIMSVRQQPSREEIESADELYRKISAGQKMASSWREKLDFVSRLSLKGKMYLVMAAIAVLLMGDAALMMSGNPDISITGELVSKSVIMLSLFFMLYMMIVRGVLKPIAESVQHFNNIAEGDYNDSIEIYRHDEIGDLKRSLKSMQIKLNFDLNDARQRANEMQRIKVALDNVTSNVMVADNDLNIIYMNPAVVSMLRNAQDEIRKGLPDFDVDSLMGKNVDVFHKEPSHQREMLAKLKDTYKARIKIGENSFDLTATPVVNDEGKRLGTAVEWLDVTEQLDAEEQVQNLIDGAVRGKLDERIDAESYDGFMRKLGDGVNDLLDAVVEPLKEVIRVASALSEGDLTQNMNGSYEGEFSTLANAMNTTVMRLKETTSNIRVASNSISSASSEIAQGNGDLSQRTEEQASSLEQTASSMEQLTGTVKQNADNARQANQLAASARQQAENGGEVVGAANDAMSGINESSKKIADIITVIDEIAFQTNLLALNAAVEAARAGEQGRGFAVVASEVRNLAQRSATAAKEIKDLITDSVQKVEVGSELVSQSGKTLEEIMHSVKKVSDIVAEIAAASQEQSQGIDQVNRAVMQMDEMTQQNAALVEEAAAASESLEEQAQGLDQMMAFFSVGDDEVAPVVNIATLMSEPEKTVSSTKKPVEMVARKPRKVISGSSSLAENADEWEEF